MRLENQPNKVYLGSFNFIKGFAICVVILGHIALDFDTSRLTWFFPLFAVLKLLQTPFMPLFFIISGYVFVPNSAKTVLKKMLKSLIIPYLVVGLVFSLVQPIVTYLQTHNDQQAWNRFVSVSVAFLLGIPIPGKIILGYKLSHCAIVWFLLALFWAFNILNLILKVKTRKLQLVCVLACAALGKALFLLDFTYFCIPHGLIATSYFYVGYLLKKYKLLEKRLPGKWMYPVWVVIAVAYAFWGHFDLCYGDFRFFPVDYFGVVFLALLLLVVGIRLGRYEWKIIDAVNNVGIYSYWVVCIHSIEQKCIPWKAFVGIVESCPNIGFVITLIIKAIIIIACCKLLKMMEKRRYRKQKKAYVLS